MTNVQNESILISHLSITTSVSATFEIKVEYLGEHFQLPPT